MSDEEDDSMGDNDGDPKDDSEEDDDQATVLNTGATLLQQQVYNQASQASNQPIRSLINASASTSATATNASTAQRVRRYENNKPGPFNVIIRECGKGEMRPMMFTTYINTTYKSTQMIQRSPGKIKVVLKNCAEANKLVVDSFFKNYRVNIPQHLVEVAGAVNWNDLCCNAREIEMFPTLGEGIFTNEMLPPCNILHAERLTRLDESGQRIMSNTVKFIFEGQILPQYVLISNLRVRVRPFINKPMHCANCQGFGHTVKFCKRKTRCAKCLEPHKTESCKTVGNSPCPFCLSNEPHERNADKCQYFAEVDESFKRKEANRRKTKLQQAISAARAGQAANEETHDSVPVHNETQFPPLSNKFASLPVEQAICPPPAPPTRQKPLNPYAAVVRKNRPQTRSRSNSKRRRDGSTASSVSIMSYDVHSPKQVSQRPKATHSTPTSTKQPGMVSPTTTALKTAIISAVRESGVSQLWISILEAIIEPILQAVLPQLPAILASFGPSVLAQSSLA